MQKTDLKIPNRLGKTVRKPQGGGGFFDLHCMYVYLDNCMVRNFWCYICTKTVIWRAQQNRRMYILCERQLVWNYSVFELCAHTYVPRARIYTGRSPAYEECTRPGPATPRQLCNVGWGVTMWRTGRQSAALTCSLKCDLDVGILCTSGKCGTLD